MTKLARLRRRLAPAFGLTAAIALASCSQTGPASTTPTSAGPSAPPTSATLSTPSSKVTNPTPSASTPATRRVDITVKGKQVTPEPAMVSIASGESLTITITGDHDNELHAHGFNIEAAIKAGQPLTITVKGAVPGVYDIELHDPELRLLQVAVR